LNDAANFARRLLDSFAHAVEAPRTPDV
jgi:hypothetical protein